MIDPVALLEDLTEPQRQAATHVDGPLLIVAGAGSGKTRVITRRVAYLVSQGIPASSILAITFTNKAAGEMKHRVAAVLDRAPRDWGRLDQPSPMICTFHSLCLRVLKHYATVVGLTPSFAVFDSADQNKLMKDAIKALEMSPTNFPPSTIHGTISNAKNKLVTAEEYARGATDFYTKNVARVFVKYQALLKANNALDFDDLLLVTANSFRQHPEVLKELQERFKYILIDEYQDTNHAQYILAHALAQAHRNIAVVGDPDQSIYAWRGADIQNILDFEKDYPDAVIVRLEQNYRSTKTVLAIASQLIAKNTRRKEKSLWTENDQGENAELLLCQEEHDEAQQVTERLKYLHEQDGYAWNGMAIFYRMNSLSRVMEDALRRAGVPYQIARGVEFYNRKEIKDVLAYLRAVANPHDEVSLARIANVPTRGISDATLKSLQGHAFAHGLSLWGAFTHARDVPGLSARAGNSIQAFVTMMEHFRAIANGEAASGNVFSVAKGPVQTVMEQVIQRSGLEAMLLKEDPDKEHQVPNVNELVSAAAEYDKEHPQARLDEYLSAVSLVSDADHLQGAGGAVTLMTLHAAKGLEFPVVAIIGLEEGCLPHARARGSPAELEEERRLCFVGITRAQERLILSNASYRTIRGLRERTVPSPFLAEMPQELFEVTDRTGVSFGARPRYGERDASLDGPPRDIGKSSAFSEGQLVRHPTFGLGRIAELNEMGSQTRAVVQFNTHGRKTLILEYARLEAVG